LCAFLIIIFIFSRFVLFILYSKNAFTVFFSSSVFARRLDAQRNNTNEIEGGFNDYIKNRDIKRNGKDGKYIKENKNTQKKRKN
jgi:hypothetical protein